MTGFIQIATTLEKREDAERIGQALVAERLAACAQIVGPIASTYWWKGKIEQAGEWICLIKTRASLFDKVTARIRELHPYEVPEVVATPIVASSPSYLQWMKEEVID